MMCSNEYQLIQEVQEIIGLSNRQFYRLLIALRLHGEMDQIPDQFDLPVGVTKSIKGLNRVAFDLLRKVESQES